jgi:hypothetical protein
VAPPTALEIPSQQASVEYEDRQQITATFGNALPKRSLRSWKSDRRSSPTSEERLVRRSGETALVTGGS